MKKLFSFVLLLAAFAASAHTYDLTSPDGEVKVSVNVSNGGINCIEYSVDYGDEKILLPSWIGLEFKDMPLSYVVRNVQRRSIDQMHTAVVPVKSRYVADKCNELKINFKGGWSVVFRAYDDGVAYRFETAFKNKEVYVTDEIAEYAFAEDNDVYWANEKSPEFITHCEAFFKEMKVSEIVKEQYAYLPVSMKTASGTRAVITEADMFDYPNMFLFGGEGKNLTAEYPQVLLSYDMRTDRDVTVTEKADYIAKTKGTRTYPWRILTLGDDRSLLQRSTTMMSIGLSQARFLGNGGQCSTYMALTLRLASIQIHISIMWISLRSMALIISLWMRAGLQALSMLWSLILSLILLRSSDMRIPRESELSFGLCGLR